MKMSRVGLTLLFVVTAFGCCRSDEAKWTSRDGDKGELQQEASARYAVSEVIDDDAGGFRPFFPGSFRPGIRPTRPSIHGPNNPGVLVGPGGPTGIVNRPGAGFIRPGFQGPHNPGVLVGPGGPTGIVNRPHFEADSFRRPPIPNFDSCKCSYSFNCPELAFGSCGNGKRYCCYNSRRVNGAPSSPYYRPGSHAYYPGQRPNYYEPVNFFPSTNNYGRPPYNSGYQLPGHYFSKRGDIGPNLDRKANESPAADVSEDDVAIFARTGNTEEEKKSS